MSNLIVALLALATLIGAALTALQQSSARFQGLFASLRLLHGLAGPLGLICLIWMLSGRVRVDVLFWDAVALLAAALATGLVIWLRWQQLRQSRGMVLFLHGFLGLTGAALAVAALRGT